MNEKEVVLLLEQYDREILQVRKGRGALLADTKEGCLIFKEYEGNPEKLPLINAVLTGVKNKCDVPVEQLIANKEGQLFTEDSEGKRYVLKTYFESRECDIKEEKECIEAVETLAKLHQGLRASKEEVQGKLPAYPIENELNKHNRELKRIWQYLRKKGQKSPFEILLIEKYPYFLEKAQQCTLDITSYLETQKDKNMEYDFICHGDYRYHNIIRQEEGFAIINFEKIMVDCGARDLALFLRKLLEKSNWSIPLGNTILEAYNRINPLTECARKELYYRLAYPEKFWKIVNFYFNSRKVWIPEKNGEKLWLLGEQEKEKQTFLKEILL